MTDDITDDWWIKEDDEEEEEKDTPSTKKHKKLHTNEITQEEISNIEKKKKKRKKSTTNGMPANGMPANGMPANGMPANGTPANSTPIIAKSKKKRKSHSYGTHSDLVQLISDYFKTKKSKLELDEILQCFSCPSHDNRNSKQTIQEYWQTILPESKWEKLSEKNSELFGAPIVIIISSSAVRCIEIGKELKQLTTKAKFQYLFAKHRKLNEQILMLQKTQLNVIIGTPKRIEDVMNQRNGALNLKRLKYLFIDWNYANIKEQRLIDIQQLKQELINLLCSEQSLLRQKFLKNKTKICLI